MQTNQSLDDTPKTLTDLVRSRFKGVVDPIGAFLNRLGLTPNTMTLVGVTGNLVGAIFLAQGRFVVGGLIILAMGPIDALDGTMARLRGEPTEFGGFVDSVTDRYSELLIFGGLLTYYALQNQPIYIGLTFAAAFGSVLVSYVRARAEGLGFQAKVGLMTRMERFLILAPSLVLSIPWLGVGIIALFANITALQRILAVRRQAHDQEKL
jgi:CDP-diacylglycerol--glycerol-3-phosphate 3-phosphatidyltransferase